MADSRAMAVRHYRGPEDVVALQSFTARSVGEAGQRGYLHPGDVAHRIYGGLRNDEPEELVTIWEDASGIAAWILVSPRHEGFDAQLRPDLRGGNFERSVLEVAEQRTRDALAARGLRSSRLIADAFDGEQDRIEALEELGWSRGDEPYELTLRPLDAIPVVATPGYIIRQVRGVEEAEEVVGVHAASFGSKWLPGQYRSYMDAPGYAPERELVAESADGELAGFTVTWHDAVNGVGLFEPVGVHPDHRRRSLGRALLAEGMRQMAAARLTHAMVMYEEANPASGALYRGMGFEPTWTIWDYTKPL